MDVPLYPDEYAASYKVMPRPFITRPARTFMAGAWLVPEAHIKLDTSRLSVRDAKAVGIMIAEGIVTVEINEPICERSQN